jgi:hypothetical protein
MTATTTAQPADGAVDAQAGSRTDDRERSEFDDDNFVPVERRVLGLDRRTVPMALVVIGLVVLATVALPLVDQFVKTDNTTKAGDVLLLAGANELTMAAPTGWDLGGVRVGEATSVGTPSKTTLSSDGVTVTVKVAAFDGTAVDLMDRVDDLNVRQEDALGVGSISQRLDSTVMDATPVIVEVYTGLDQKGVLMAFVTQLGTGDKVGVEVIVTGSADAVTQKLAEIATMVDSVKVQPRKAS